MKDDGTTVVLFVLGTIALGFGAGFWGGASLGFLCAGALFLMAAIAGSVA